MFALPHLIDEQRIQRDQLGEFSAIHDIQWLLSSTANIARQMRSSSLKEKRFSAVTDSLVLRDKFLIDA